MDMPQAEVSQAVSREPSENGTGKLLQEFTGWTTNHATVKPYGQQALPRFAEF